MAGLIPDEILAEIVERCDVVEVVSEYVQLRKRGRNWFGLCPFHQEDTPSFSVSQDKQLYKCFGCGKGGDVISFVQEMEHLSFGEAAHKLAERCHVTIPERALSPEELQRQQQRQSLLQIHTLAAEFFRQQLSASPLAAAYLQRRGVNRAMIERFGLGFSPESDWQALHQYLSQQGFGESVQILSGLVSRSGKNGRLYDKFHGRLVFPIRDHKGQTVAFGGRIIGDDEPKYLNSQTTPIYNKSQLLYGLDVAASAIAKSGQAVIMEGYMDVLTAHQYGVENAVASLGTAFTDQQAQLLRRLAPPAPGKLQVLLSFDGDGAGAKAALTSLEKLRRCSFAEPQVLVYPESLDPDDFLRRYGDKGGWQRLLERCRYPALDYLLLRSLERHDSASAVGKGEIVADLLPALRSTESATERDSFISQMAAKIGVAEGSIRADLARGRVERPTAAAPAPPPPQSRPPLPELVMQILAMAISDREALRLVQEKKELFRSYGPLPAEVLDFVSDLGERYSFKTGALFHYLSEENEGLRDFLLKLINTETPEGDMARFTADYLQTLRFRQLDQRLAELQKQIAALDAEGTNSDDLVLERYRLIQEKKGL